jgi:prepilin-type processing-associated H-X9-DG protein
VNYGNTDQGQSLPIPIPPATTGAVAFRGAPFTAMGSPYVDDTGYGVGMATLTVSKIASITDGLSNTLMASELLIGTPGGTDLRGYTWWGPSTSFTAALTPNSTYPDSMGNGGCGTSTAKMPCNGGITNPNSSNNTLVYLGARSQHPGGVNSAMCDGSVKFFKNTINIATWQAVSTTQGGEVISSDSY